MNDDLTCSAVRDSICVDSLQVYHIVSPARKRARLPFWSIRWFILSFLVHAHQQDADNAIPLDLLSHSSTVLGYRTSYPERLFGLGNLEYHYPLKSALILENQLQWPRWISRAISNGPG